MLGPCPCSACGHYVVWNGWSWLEAATPTQKHICANPREAERQRLSRKFETLEMRRGRDDEARWRATA